MITVYIRRTRAGGNQLQDEFGNRIDVPTSTVTSAAKHYNVTDTLRRAVRAALNESVVLRDMRDES